MYVLIIRYIELVVLGLLLYPPGDARLQGELRQAKTQSSIMYTLQHPLHTVYGVSQQVSSQISLAVDGKTIQQVTVTVPVESFDSGNRARDRDMLKVTEADRYPDVTFLSSDIREQNGRLQVTGQLTFHGHTKEISFPARQTWQSGDMVVNGEFDISLDGYSVKRPSIFGMKVRDVLHIRFHIVYPAA
jgi:polyisoprenoid-binding protein YceI